MRNMNKAIAIICLIAVMICMGYRIKARAEGFPQVLAKTAASDLSSIQYAYLNLTSEQKDIASYLLGSFNHIYLMARGFSYSIPANETSWKAQFKALGNKVFSYAFSSYNWRSRFNETFRQYLSSIVVYASGISTTFEQWYTNNSGAGELYIPYSEDALSAWTDFYNDPTGDGIAHFGDILSEWDLGIMYDFAFTGTIWYSNSETIYNQFILNYSPVIYSNVEHFQNDGQYVIGGFDTDNLVDAIFIERSQNSYRCRYGFSDFRPLGNSYGSYPNLYLENYGNNSIGIYTRPENNVSFNLQVYNITGQSIYNVVHNFFNTVQVLHLDYVNASYWYYFINHVYLVDDINTLSNPEEVFYTNSLNIEAPDTVHEPYIIAPNDRLLFPTRPVGYDDPLGFWDIVIDNSVDENGDPVTSDDFHQQIVNNTTINNYYVTNDDRINVPVEWFENDLTDQLANDSIPFLTFARDCIDTLGDLQIYFYGAVVFGLGGGILKKFLL